MSPKPPRIFIRIALVLLIVGLAGCNGGRSYRVGLDAEKRGDASRAYDEYLRAGARHRSATVAQAIERVAPLAAGEAESAALAAMDAGQYGDAWRMLIRALKIQPSHPNVPQLIRRLETEHPEEIAVAKVDYTRRGFAALAMIRPPPTAVARAEPETRRRSEPVRPPRRAQPDRPRRAEPAAEPTKPVQPAAPKATPVVPPPLPEEPAPRETRDQRGVYTLIHLLSTRDRRYHRQVLSIDGITIRLKDTDDDREVDLDLYDGKERIQKIRELELGRSQTFRGRSGGLYRLTILHVHHKSRTVRIGIRPA